MKLLSLMILLLTLVACGKESKTNSSSSSTQLSYNGLQLNTTTLYIPDASMVGGGPTVKINGTDYRIDSSKSDPQVSQYVSALSSGFIVVTPKTSSRYGKEYNAGYAGRLEQGACLSNPMATCTNAVLTQLFAF